jgi:hypothetical protein
MPLDLSSYEKATAALETGLITYATAQQPEGSPERELMRDGVIQRFEYLKSRNLTTHTYEPATAKVVFQSAQAFLGDASYLLEQLCARAQ